MNLPLKTPKDQETPHGRRPAQRPREILRLPEGCRLRQHRVRDRGHAEDRHVEVVPATEATTDYYAAIYRELKARGKPIPTNDMWIAASAVEFHATLYSLDAHFRLIPMLNRL